MKLLHVSQLVKITCAAARRKNCGGVSKFRLAWQRAKFFPAAAVARQGVGWLRWRNLAAEGSTSTLVLWHHIAVGLYIRGGECQSERQPALTDAYDVRDDAVYIYFGSSNIRTSKTWPLCVHNYFSTERYTQRADETTKYELASLLPRYSTCRRFDD